MLIRMQPKILPVSDFQEKYFCLYHTVVMPLPVLLRKTAGVTGSVGGAWLINKEGFMRNLTWLST